MNAKSCSSTVCVGLRSLSDNGRMAQQTDAITPKSSLHGYDAFTTIKYLEQNYLSCAVNS